MKNLFIGIAIAYSFICLYPTIRSVTLKVIDTVIISPQKANRAFYTDMFKGVM